jgi:hypothetical protein
MLYGKGCSCAQAVSRMAEFIEDPVVLASIFLYTLGETLTVKSG